MEPTVSVVWKGGMAFESTPPSGQVFTMDAYPDSGGQGLGPTPVEALLSSIAACTAMDVISILQKKQQKVTSYKIEVTWDRGPEGVWPRPITAVRVRHIFEGENIDEAAAARSIQLSDEKYCTVAATLRIPTEISSTYEVVAG
jgi:putative redox protein